MTANGLANTGTIDLTGGAGTATLDITAAAPATWTGTLSSGDALLEFKSGGITAIGRGAGSRSRARLVGGVEQRGDQQQRADQARRQRRHWARKRRCADDGLPTAGTWTSTISAAAAAA